MENSSTISYEQPAADPLYQMPEPPSLPSSLLLQLKALPLPKLQEVLLQLPDQTVLALMYDWEFWARPEQLEPSTPWLVWMLLTGRGFGKTRTGAETVRKYVKQGRAKAIGLVAPTTADVRDTMLGLKPGAESGLLQVCPPWDRPVYRPSYRDVVWPATNGPHSHGGASATIFSGEEPNRLRGPQHDFVWWDEPSATDHPDEVEAMLLFGLRLGEAKLLMTGTPLPIPLITRLRRDAEKTKSNPALGTYITTGSMYDNTFLAPSAIVNLRRKYEGTRMGRQEIYGEVLDDNPDALWTQRMVDDDRMHPADFAAQVASGAIRLRRLVVAVDPAGTSTKDSNLTGISVAVIDDRSPSHAYVLDDATMLARPDAWARKSVQLLKFHAGDRIVGEKNYGGDMVENTIRQVDPNVPFRAVTASRGKIIRAEPVSALYEQHRVHHVSLMGPADPDVPNNPNHLAALEEQMTTYDGDPKKTSPDRLDALVWALTDLIIDQENSAEAAILYLERRAGKCANCNTLNYMPAGQRFVFCRQCKQPIEGYQLPDETLAQVHSSAETPEEQLIRAERSDMPLTSTTAASRVPPVQVNESEDPAANGQSALAHRSDARNDPNPGAPLREPDPREVLANFLSPRRGSDQSVESK